MTIFNENKYIQSCLTTVSFPDSINGVLNMVRENKNKANWLTDIDCLLNFGADDSVFWTAPKWLTENDILFFYHTKRSKQRTANLLAQAKCDLSQNNNLIELLERADNISAKYAGKIFGCALVSGDTQNIVKQNKHYKSSFFAPLKKVHIFDNPLSENEYADCIKIGLNTITPLYKREFEGIKKLLRKQNTLPNFLQNTTLGDLTFKNVNRNNWASISCVSTTKFIHESQFRTYLLDYVLNELKDKGTSLLEECDCFRENKYLGRADYFVRVFDHWIAVEAKLSLLKEQTKFSQATKYTNIDSFIPTKGARRLQKRKLSKTAFCIVVDQHGVYFVGDSGQFIKSKGKNIIWKREELSREMIPQIRETIKTLLDSQLY